MEDVARIGPIIEPKETLRTALTIIREAVETLGPPGAIPDAKWSEMNVLEETELIVVAIQKIAAERDAARSAKDPYPFCFSDR